MLLPFIAFWVLLFFSFDELGFKGVAIAVLIWLALLVGFALAGISAHWFVAAQAILDIGLILIVFGGDIKIR